MQRSANYRAIIKHVTVQCRYKAICTKYRRKCNLELRLRNKKYSRKSKIVENILKYLLYGLLMAQIEFVRIALKHCGL
jgi:hypothetical protein